MTKKEREELSILIQEKLVKKRLKLMNKANKYYNKCFLYNNTWYYEINKQMDK